ncbi:MAG: proline dehydrogenase family protein [Haloferacaceae archaeon]
MLPPIADRFVAGESPATAFEHARQMNGNGVGVILNLLGEHYDDPELAEEDTRTYLDLVEDIAGTGLNARVSVKPSQLGLDVDDDLFRENYLRIVEAGAEHDVFVWCDMEDATTTDVTLEAFEEAMDRYPWGVGLCVQANLHRTMDDVERLIDRPGHLRLVKGAYNEDPEISHREKQRVNEAYRELIRYAFRNRDRGVGIGSHDPEMISFAKRLHDEHGTGFEVQMLMGVREAEQRDLAAQGYEVWQYAPFGTRWFSYFYRRLRERKENARFVLRALLGE